jgi:hypothetical protein
MITEGAVLFVLFQLGTGVLATLVLLYETLRKEGISVGLRYCINSRNASHCTRRKGRLQEATRLT